MIELTDSSSRTTYMFKEVCDNDPNKWIYWKVEIVWVWDSVHVTRRDMVAHSMMTEKDPTFERVGELHGMDLPEEMGPHTPHSETLHIAVDALQHFRELAKLPRTVITSTT